MCKSNYLIGTVANNVETNKVPIWKSNEQDNNGNNVRNKKNVPSQRNAQQMGESSSQTEDVANIDVEKICVDEESVDTVDDISKRQLKVPSKASTGAWSGMVRVIHATTDKRVLLKGMKGEIQDLEFAYIDDQIILAIIDEHGHTYIHSIMLQDNELRSSLVLEIMNDNPVAGTHHRVVWCPYIPGDDDTDSDTKEVKSRLLLTTHYNTARIWKMWGIVSELPEGVLSTSVSAITATDSPHLISVSDHTAAIVDAAFSPDATALATASADGYVMFFQVYMHNEKTARCLHRWQPHDGKPLSCLFFLDNHKNYSIDVLFWKYAVTGADRNECLKIWCCKSWECHQTISFAADISPELEPCGMKAVLDSTAEYLLLSDLRRRCFYVLHLKQDGGEGATFARRVTEYLLPFPVLSFAISDAGTRSIVCSSRCEDPYYLNGGSGEDGSSPITCEHVEDLDDLELSHVNGEGDSDGHKTLLKLLFLQPKGLQEAKLIYSQPGDGERRQSDQSDLGSMQMVTSPEPEVEDLEMDSAYLQSQQLKNMLMIARNSSAAMMGQRSDSPPCAPPTAPQFNLMTPDAFSSPGKRDEEDPPIMTSPEPGLDQRAGLVLATPPPVYSLEDVPPKYTSGGSSPSREVQEILSLQDEPYLKPEQPSDGAHDEQYYDSRKDDAATETIWPSITIAQINEANQRKATSDKSASQSINNSLMAESNVNTSANEENGSDGNQPAHRERMSLGSYDRSRLDAIEVKLEKLTDMMAEQNHLLRTLREEQRPVDPGEAIDRALQDHTKLTAAAIDDAFDQRWCRVEKAAAGAGAAAADAVGAGMARVLDPLTRTLQRDFATYMATTDTRLRDNIEKLVLSKSIQESIGNAVSRSLSGVLRDALREVLGAVVVPALDKAGAQLFRQVSQAFQTGTKEFAANTQECARSAAERGAGEALESLRRELQRQGDLLAGVAAATKQPQHQQLTVVLYSAVRSVLEEEMVRWREQATSVLELSRSHTPNTPRALATPHQDTRQMELAQITKLLKKGELNEAFQVALSAADLSLVTHTCRAADPARVFYPACQLRQNVLLSLVQQLAADMTRDTQLKLKYLEEAIINLDASADAVTREYMPVLMRDLKRQLSAFLAAHPAHQLAKEIKMLLMATDSLLAKATM